jgi:hypothetical protein
MALLFSEAGPANTRYCYDDFVNQSFWQLLMYKTAANV